MKVIIIEDEAITARKLEVMLQKIDSSINIAAKLESVRQSIAWLKENELDLIFLDIHLADGDAFEILKHIKLSTPIIFTTAYDHYAIEAFKVNSIDYLLKPVSLDSLKQALEKYRFLQARGFSVDFSGLLNAIKKQDYQKRFMITTGQKILTIPVEDIAYFFAHEKLVFLLSLSNNRYVHDQSLEALEGKLDPSTFFRINRKLIISQASIKQMYHYPKSRVKIELVPPLSENIEAIVSVERSEGFKLWLNK
jgi:two-component system, LytTR family, response regulator LytT